MQLNNRVIPVDDNSHDEKYSDCNDDEKLFTTSPSSNGQINGKSAYESLMLSLHNDPKWMEEVTLGRRVGLYRFRGDLGSGNFSHVKMAVHQLTKESVAIKMVDKNKLDEKTRRMLFQEISSMEQMQHPNIIRLYEVLETYGKVYLVTEYARCGDLFHKVTSYGRLEEPIARHIFGQIASAVSHMHEKLIIHRDIKAENIFFSSPNRVKLGDFGFSAQLSKGFDEPMNMFCGSPPYAAPELFRDDTYVGGPVDVWALGVLLYFIIVGRMPFRGQTVPQIKEHILQGTYYMPRNITQEATDLIESILKQDPKERPTVERILKSQWLEGVVLPSLADQMQSYILQPTVPPYKPPNETAIVVMSEVEKVARERLETLGISEALLAAHAPQGSRSHVIGCYRIIIHRVERQMGVFCDFDKPITAHDDTRTADQAKNTLCRYFRCSWRKQRKKELPSSTRCCCIIL